MSCCLGCILLKLQWLSQSIWLHGCWPGKLGCEEWKWGKFFYFVVAKVGANDKEFEGIVGLVIFGEFFKDSFKGDFGRLFETITKEIFKCSFCFPKFFLFWSIFNKNGFEIHAENVNSMHKFGVINDKDCPE